MAATRRKKQQRLELNGALWISVGDQNLGGQGRMALLQAIAELGSITHAAKACGLSYRGAWQAINTMNTLADRPLVDRLTGGRRGGYTQLTEHGRKLVERYAQLDAVHQRLVRLLDRDGMDLDVAFSLFKVLNMRTSARNQWVGTVTSVRAGSVNDEVELTLPGGARLAAIVTQESTEWLALRTQQTAIALVKASAVLLAVDAEGVKLSARNRLDGTVRTVVQGSVNAEITVDSTAGVPVVAVVPRSTSDELGLAPGAPVTAFVKASDILLAVVD